MKHLSISVALTLSMLLVACGGSIKRTADADTDGEDASAEPLEDGTVPDADEDAEPDAPEDPTPEISVDPIPDASEDPAPDGVTGTGDCSSPFTAHLGDLTENLYGAGNDYETSCDPYPGGMGSGPDQFWVFTPSSDGTLTVTLSSDAFDFCALAVMSTCGDVTSELAADCEPYPATDGVCEVSLSVTSGTTYYIVAESHSESDPGGEYDLSLSM